jgi:hypothetical protein
MAFAHKPTILSVGIAALPFAPTFAVRCFSLSHTVTQKHRQKHQPAEKGRHASPLPNFHHFTFHYFKSRKETVIESSLIKPYAKLSCQPSCKVKPCGFLK